MPKEEKVIRISQELYDYLFDKSIKSVDGKRIEPWDAVIKRLTNYKPKGSNQGYIEV